MVPRTRPVPSLDDPDDLARPAQRHVVGGPVRRAPRTTRWAAAAGSPGRRARRPGRRPGPEHRQVRLAQRQLGRRGGEVRGQDVRVVGVQDGGLHRLPEQRLGVVDHVGVERVVGGHEHRERPGAGPARLARPAATARPGCPGQPASSTASSPLMSMPSSRALVAASPTSVPVTQRSLELAALLGQITAPVCRDRAFQRAASTSARSRRALAARASTPARDRANATVCTPPATRSASRSAASLVALRRTGVSPGGVDVGAGQGAGVRAGRRAPTARRSSPREASRPAPPPRPADRPGGWRGPPGRARWPRRGRRSAPRRSGRTPGAAGAAAPRGGSRRRRGRRGTRRSRRSAAPRRNGAHRSCSGQQRVVHQVGVGEDELGVVADPAALLRGVSPS